MTSSPKSFSGFSSGPCPAQLVISRHMYISILQDLHAPKFLILVKGANSHPVVKAERHLGV